MNIHFKKLFVTLGTCALLLGMACTTEETEEELEANLEVNAELVTLRNQSRSVNPHNTVKGILWDNTAYTNIDLAIGLTGGFNVSFVLGDFGANDADAILDMQMRIARKSVLDYNRTQFGDSVLYATAYAYNLRDAVMDRTFYTLTKKGGGTLFVTKNGKYRVESYPFGDTFDPDNAFSTAARFASNDNGLYDDAIELLNANLYYFEDEIFEADEQVTIPMHLFADYRMLLHLRYLVKQGATNIRLAGENETGTTFEYELLATSDLLALANQFEEDDLEYVYFFATGDYRIDYFRGFVFSSENPEPSNHDIEYKFGQRVTE